MTSKRDILGVRVLAAAAPEAVAAVDAHLGPGPAMVAFLNAHVSNLAARDPELMAALGNSLVLNDGIGVDIASRVIHGASFPGNLNGTDFTPRYLRETRHVFRIFAVGSAPGVAQRALDELIKIAPRHSCIGAHDGFFSDDARVAREILASGATLVLVAMGTPRQEIWAARHLMTANGPSVICVGGLLDFISGEKPRAPLWMRKLRLEWLFRLLVEPRRLWRRYLIGNAVFLKRLACARFRPS